jgi:lysozyme
MKVSEQGLRLIKKHEGYRSEPYLDAVKIPTIGYGNTFYPDGTKVTMQDKPLSKEVADLLLKVVVSKFEKCVNDNVIADISQEQFDALVSFSYNLGCGALRKSTLLKKVNDNPCDPSILKEFLKWNKAGGKVLRGLTNRRIDEANYYFGDTID